MRVVRKVLKRIGMALAGLLAALLLAELAVRVVGIAPPPTPEGEGSETRASKDPVLRFENRPSSKRTITYRDSVDAEPRQVHVSVNALGLRGPETTIAKPPGVQRIICLGDSFTFGFGVSNDETWPAALQVELARRTASDRYEVLNFGVSAYDTEQEVRLLRKRALNFAPDLVIIAWYLNDPAVRDGSMGFEFGAPPAMVRLLNNRATGPIATLRKYSQLADVICDRLYRASYSRYLPSVESRLYEDVHPGWRRAKAALLRARDILAERDIKLLVAMYPTLMARDGHLVSHEAYAKVEAYCKENGIEVLDLEPVFEHENLKAMRVHANDSHPSAEAHRMAGAAIAEHLLSGLLKE